MSDEDDEHLHVLLERQVLRDRQRAPRSEQALDRGVVGQVQEEHDALEGARALELLHEEGRLAMGDAHRTEHDGELLTADLTRAWRMICAASSLAGRPEPEKIGSF